MMEKNQKKELIRKHGEDVTGTVETIKKELERFDTIDLVKTPDDNWFEQFVAIEMKRQKKQFRRDLTLFLILAAVILSTIIFTLMARPFFFLVLQAAAVAFTFFYTGMRLRKREELHEKQS
ncbi:YxlC family protein [Mesobacillus foraminis]|nr:YxlC family protein [Mesobacillus foraminis]